MCVSSRVSYVACVVTSLPMWRVTGGVTSCWVLSPTVMLMLLFSLFILVLPILSLPVCLSVSGRKYFEDSFCFKLLIKAPLPNKSVVLPKNPSLCSLEDFHIVKEIQVNNIFLHFVKLLGNIPACKWSLTQTQRFGIMYPLPRCLRSPCNVRDHIPVDGGFLGGLPWGPWVGERRAFKVARREVDITLKADIQMTFSSHAPLISSCQDYFCNPFTGPPTSRLLLLLTALVRYTFLRGCFIPSKTLMASCCLWN